jgi:hypothetical protein
VIKVEIVIHQIIDDVMKKIHELVLEDLDQEIIINQVIIVLHHHHRLIINRQIIIIIIIIMIHLDRNQIIMAIINIIKKKIDQIINITIHLMTIVY